MRILDINNIEITNPDDSLGYLVKDSIFISHHEAIQGVEEQGHWETIAEYSNGGKDVKWVVDIEKVEASEAWDEYEDIYRYILYTKEELAEIEKNKTQYIENITMTIYDELENAYQEGVNSI